METLFYDKSFLPFLFCISYDFTFMLKNIQMCRGIMLSMPFISQSISNLIWYSWGLMAANFPTLFSPLTYLCNASPRLSLPNFTLVWSYCIWPIFISVRFQELWQMIQDHMKRKLIQKETCTPVFYSSTIYNSQDIKAT